MSFNPSSIELKVLFDTVAKAEQFIKKFAEGYRQILGSLPPSFTNARLINSSDPRKQYLGLKEIYQRKIPYYLVVGEGEVKSKKLKLIYNSQEGKIEELLTEKELYNKLREENGHE